LKVSASSPKPGMSTINPRARAGPSDRYTALGIGSLALRMYVQPVTACATIQKPHH
jgi:hypothetical protein